ncbi:MAG: zinc metalloprotease HtpX [Halofilum sp. (in: g-proteobacteria)]|nr:zinc metalloprotease HtpX [Halofilum sp. (in: g-proteobacteria)]
MQSERWREHRWFNAAQSLLLLLAMASLAAALGTIVAGAAGAVWALALSAVLVILNARLAPRLVLRLYRAEPMPEGRAGMLHEVVERLAERAGLPAPPVLYRVPSSMVNAFAVGSRQGSAIALTDATLRTLTPRELTGVLAHEMSHIRHNDLWVMGLADLFTRVTHAFSTFGQLLLVLNLPLILLSDYQISWTAIAILIFAPLVSLLIQLALSRTREYEADMGAVELSGDPEGLASALQKMEQFHANYLEQIVTPGRRVPDPSLLRTHPGTEERVRRLLESGASDRSPVPGARVPPEFAARHDRPPRWYPMGIWR